MNLIELERSLRQLRLGGMAAVLETRLRQAQVEHMPPIDLISCLVADELTRRSDRLLERRQKEADAPKAQAGVARQLEEANRAVLAAEAEEEVVDAVAAAVGIPSDRAFGGVLPSEKAAVVERVRAAHGSVGMVGDGINDAPALAAADVGIAVGGGTDVASDAASATISSGSPSAVPALVDLARATTRTIRQNLAWAFGYNLLLVPLWGISAAGGVWAATLLVAAGLPAWQAWRGLHLPPWSSALALVVGAAEGAPLVALGIQSRVGPAWRSMRGGEIDSRIEPERELHLTVVLDMEADQVGSFNFDFRGVGRHVLYGLCLLVPAAGDGSAPSHSSKRRPAEADESERTLYPQQREGYLVC